MSDAESRDLALRRPSAGSGTLAAVALLALLTIFRLVYAAQLGLAEDEAYYWQWSRHLASSYYDQGPGIAYIIHLGTILLGDRPLGVRLMTILLAAGTGWAVYDTVLLWTSDSRAALASLILLNVSPLIAAGSVLATYDGPQVFFWALSLLLLTKTLQNDNSAGWYLVGIAAGLGLLCKLTMLLFAPGVLIFLVWSPAYRKHLSTPHPYVAFAIMLALFAPVVAWNESHGWMGFLHAVSLGSRRRDAPPFRWFGDFLGGQAIALGPFLFLAELYTISKLALKPQEQHVSPDAARFLVAFAAPTLALCLIVSLKSKMEINWPAPTHLMGLAAVAVWFADIWRNGQAFKRAGIALATAVSLLLTLLAFFPSLLTMFGRPISASAAQKLNETFGWEQIAERVESARLKLEHEDGKPVFIAGVNYRVNSVLAYYLPDHPQTQELYFGVRRDQYLVWTDPRRLVGQNAILCFDEDNQDALALASTFFGSIKELPSVEIYRSGFEGPVKKWHLYECRGFRGYNPESYLKGY